MAFSTRIVVNFGDTDPAGLVYFPNIFHYCHMAMERFFEEICGASYHVLIDQHRVGFPTVKISSEFKSPLRYGDSIDIQLNVSSVGNKSLSLSYRITNTSGAVCAEVSQVVVAMDLTRHQSIPIPEFIRQKLTTK
jgi:4-hydroxybenzoyl-CoA thioesterase